MTSASTSAPAKKAARKSSAAKAASPNSSAKSTSGRSSTARGSGSSSKSAKSTSADNFTGNFAGYSKGAYGKAYDEMFDAAGEVRTPYRGIYKAMADEGQSDLLEARVEALGRAYLDQGVTFSLSGQERPFPLDVVPRVISASEWSKLEAGITQRVQALELFLDDIYGEQEILRDGVLPKRLVHSCEHFHRQAANIRPPNGVRIHVAGIDLIRDETGDFRVLEDNLRSPSGVSYVLENRRAMARVFPDLFSKHKVRAVADYPSHLLRALRASAAFNEADPNIVVLTPGVANSAYFEHSLLARLMGVELVEGRDLFCRDNIVYMRTTEGEQRVDVIYRRIDDEYLDPMQFRPDSMLGVAGLLNAARAGNVVISSAVGNGVGDDKLIYTYVPEIIQYYLGEKPSLQNVDTLRCWLPEECEEVLDRIDELVVKPVEGSGGYGIVFGPDATKADLDTLARKVRNDPRGWIAQPVVQLSTVPTKIGDDIRPRHVDLRPFAVNDGESVWVLPGGLTRVALPEGSLVVNSSQGGGSKDTWVLASRTSEGDREFSGAKVVTTSGVAAARPAESAPDPLHTQTQQQQQGSMSQQLGTMSQTQTQTQTATQTQTQGGDVR
ncbi:circularly permuted type 2 ATP-grasp protein [Gordonia jinghuaiqii]|uniref:Circularly permuted type 2 ATP-grasp protein n=1 Tax=Gordonia jinghuaiqii TaxID=2758710 RepID=A0A7D7LPS5_9ACTN|nr:circularly permuted type 2 ATP-grasp protein [Gordonia jinghuaiqii]MCR5977086.1 circularly permuted type 2 ATP-grasp protein [Gordonia jinghuaiqii]QMT00305.1 circularly permuted type 2 ATP-grasp protein [Gordonia jinghuaiqii]